MVQPRLSEGAPAKVNLCLHITGQRSDGYHLLDSLIVFAAVGDRLHAQKADRFSLTIEGPFAAGLTTGEDNLVLRAARAVAPEQPLAFRLEKALPLASGIGGGSSDAAAAVRLARRIAGEAGALSLAERQALAALGADVPACLQPMPARMRGIGEVLEPVRGLPPGWILLVNPGGEVSTPGVYRALQAKENPPLPKELPRWKDLAALADWLRLQRNDLAAPAQALAPQISQALAVLERQQGQLLSRMSGSGGTCFALFGAEAQARAAASRIAALHPQWWVAPAALLV